MIVEELQELSEPLVNGAEYFESVGHEKGMQLGELPNDIAEDVNSRWQSSSECMMVKDPVKCPCSHSLSKDQSRGR